MAQKPRLAGHAWVFLQYLLGFRRLGYDVLFLDWLDARMAEGPLERSPNAAYLREVMEAVGLGDSFSLLDQATGAALAGRPREQVLHVVGESAFLLNVMGYLQDEEILGAAPRRVFLDIDPGFGQMWWALGLHDSFAGHDAHVTIGERIGQAGCTVPVCGIEWLTTRQPVVLEHWPTRHGGERFTSVASWRGPFGPLDWEGRTYGLRVHEFRKFAVLPQLTPASFEVALDIHADETGDRELLAEHGWTIADPSLVAGELSSYRRYIQSSKAELMVAKNIYVQSRSGWFSDRSACYLASGKPVLAQDTGLGDLYPLGEGLLTFASLDEAVAGVDEICADYDRHARAARRVAEEQFDSDKVLGRLLGRLGVA